MKEIERTEVPLSDLVVHRKNLEVYWPHVDPETGAKLEDEEVSEAFVREMEDGQLNPIKIDTENRILSGARRLVAARQAGLETLDAIRYEFDGDHDEWRVVLLDNRTRREWPVYTRYMEANKLLDLYKQGVISREQLREHAEERGGDRDAYPTELAASAVGWSKSTYHHIGYVMEDDKGPAEALAEMENGPAKEKFEGELDDLRSRVRRDELSAGATYRSGKDLKEKVETELQRRAGNLDESDLVEEELDERAEETLTAIRSAASAVRDLVQGADEHSDEYRDVVLGVLQSRVSDLDEALQSLESQVGNLDSFLGGE